MATLNGATQPQTAAPDLVQQALLELLQQGKQTNAMLQQLTGEMSTLNRQLFNDRRPPTAPPLSGGPGGPTPGGPTAGDYSGGGTHTATIVPDGHWRKQIVKSTCSQIGLTKTLSLSKWKLNFYVDGEGRPASAYGRRQGEFASLIQRARVVWPEISPDHFSTELFTQRNKEFNDAGNEGNYEELFIAPQPFTVEWYEKPGGNGKTYAYIERVYPIE